ncbi:zf-HC2 domain-containing protein [Dictyobacter arantiisoli]|uniref:Putative zinc-finger domain-containing protein n=1 Tax=Dictyobacter arantiisoli TaxID=2014874 RepID=A0A5A5TCY9_9CHLR|nr:zf-HC2 domain-containing protein [Dictyobacter arantiisoli]GCF09322.1 hypothetical protein KDI_28860 [Dictyobacter arantiisoli]
MHCSQATRQIQLYTDKQLSLEKIRTLEKHLSTCGDCSRTYFLFMEIDQALATTEMIREPEDLTANVMRRVALSVQQSESQVQVSRSFLSYRPSWLEMLFASALATVAMLGLLLQLPSIRTSFFASASHNLLAGFFLTLWNLLGTANVNLLMTFLWIIGTILGIWITLIVAGSDMRTVWYKAVMDRLPVW